MLSEAPGSISFPVFLTLMADKLSGTDPEHVILDAFAAFDDNRSGLINADYLRECMTTMGDRFTDEEVSTYKGILLCLSFQQSLPLYRSISCSKDRQLTRTGTLTTRTLSES